MQFIHSVVKDLILCTFANTIDQDQTAQKDFEFMTFDIYTCSINRF